MVVKVLVPTIWAIFANVLFVPMFTSPTASTENLGITRRMNRLWIRHANLRLFKFKLQESWISLAFCYCKSIVFNRTRRFLNTRKPSNWTNRRMVTVHTRDTLATVIIKVRILWTELAPWSVFVRYSLVAYLTFFIHLLHSCYLNIFYFCR